MPQHRLDKPAARAVPDPAPREIASRTPSTRIAGVLVTLSVVFSAFALLMVSPHGLQAQSAMNNAVGDQASLVSRGAYLAKMADCAGCHTAAPATDATGNLTKPAAFAGGLAMNSPFGTIYSSNITPDPHYGIGAYTYEQFARALRSGVTPDGSHLYPAMPYPSFSKINDDDMRALYAYFMHGVTPVSKPAPETRLPFPFNQRWGLGVWAWMFSPGAPYEADSRRDAQWNRGAYLVQSLGHCGACHTPRGPAYEELGYTQSSPLYLSGGTNDHWFAPDLRSTSLSGLGRIPVADIVAFLKSGHGGGLVTFGSMVQVVEDSTQYVDQRDLEAIAVYLKSLPAGESKGNFAPDSRGAHQTVEALRTGLVQRPGAGLYMSACARCHQADGRGVEGKYPALAGNPVVLGSDTQSLIRLLIEGGRSPDTENGPAPKKMPAFADQFTEKEMARVLTFVRTTWGNSADPVTELDVHRLRSAIHR
ncbi:Alcohol dehydrogenase (quinone), cytochrome c subunit [Pararobbsia alpina]|uniref:c-type cytochrome n=1 Tax=Pararobbsia alpina TaxID=621374 RepID=UPI0039A63DD5